METTGGEAVSEKTKPCPFCGGGGELSVEDMQKIVDANEKLVKEMKDADR